MPRLGRTYFTLGAGILLCLLGALISAACGPSMQFIYEGNIRFEHCYRLDYDPKIAPPHRKACWQDWLRRFPRAQTRDRLEYAQRRIDALESGQGATLLLDLSAPLDGGVPTLPTEPAPVPTNAHAPPPARIPMPTPPALPSAALPNPAESSSARPIVDQPLPTKKP